MKKNINLLVKVNGPDKPGVTSRLMNVLPHSVGLLEISQAVVHGILSLSILIDVPKDEQGAVLMDLLLVAKEIGITLDFEVLDKKDEVKQEENHHLVCTLLFDNMQSRDFGKLAQCFAENNYNIHDINMLSVKKERKVIELIGIGKESRKENLRQSLFELSREGFNLAIQTDDAFRKNKRVVLLDLDSTFIKCEFIDELAKAYGCYEEVAKITHQAMQGQLDYRQSFEKRLSLLKGMDKSLVEKVSKQIELNDGAERLVSTLKNLGLKVGIISGGFDFLVEKLKKELKLDYAFCNKLDFDSDNKASGKIIEPFVDRQYKATLLKTVESCENIRKNQIIAVGDGANDLAMLQAAGLGIAFHAKPAVQEAAKVRLNNFGLDSILYLMGLSDFEIQRLELN